MNLKPLSDRVVVKAHEAEEKTASGIILPDTAKEKPQAGMFKVVLLSLGGAALAGRALTWYACTKIGN